ncbi:MAG: hypothetical protein M3Z33_01105 [Actinomycetota bacterium]|nr:hypothetical protein [Actinomycetota bacterium]
MTDVTWSRLEPHARTTDYAVGEAAELGDPLWLLGRQRQLGELTASDGGTPVAVDVRAGWSMLTRARIAGVEAPLDGPVEALVEAEGQLGPGPGNLAARVRAGQDLRRRLEDAGFAGVAAHLRDALAPLRAPEHPVAGDTVGEHYVTLLAGRVIDGGGALDLVRSDPGALTALVAPPAQDALLTVCSEWMAQALARWGAAGPPPAWSDEALEYDFTVAAPPLARPGAKPTVLGAAAYDGTGVDWYSFDAADGLDPGAPTGGPEPLSLTLLPAALTFPGAPADRFWELEDGAVYLGGTPAGPTDLAKLVAIDFAIVSSPDWLLVPLEVPVGSVAAVDYVVVRDTFGVATVVADAAHPQADGLGAPPFSVTGLATSGVPDDRLVVVPSPVAAVRSRPREHVTLQRDELANLAWGIEWVVPGGTGRGVDLRPQREELAVAEPALTGSERVWRLATPVPSSWFPYAASAPADARRLLVRAEFFDTATGMDRTPAGDLLSALDRIFEERVTREGLAVTVLDQIARWHDGRTYAWRGREVRPGRGEASSGLRYDDTVPTS